MSADGFQLSAACRRYLAPRVEGEAPRTIATGLPEYARLNNACAAQASTHAVHGLSRRAAAVTFLLKSAPFLRASPPAKPNDQ
ncbi:MAG TPA: hypothetical protein VNF69_03455 [Burkholderiales bacterium]|nr:hypothetical protein [Burkholderiales bacterium]